MDKLRKIGLLIWNNKERMVLIVMLIVFGYRVYQIFFPPPPPEWPGLQTPKTQLPEEPEYRQELGLPGGPPMRPPMDIPGTYATFYERNPFWYYSGQASQEARAENVNM